MNLEGKLITHEELDKLTEVHPIPILANPENNILVLDVQGEYYCIKQINDTVMEIGSKIRYNKETKQYEFRKDEDGSYMNVDEFWGLVTLGKHNRLENLVIDLPDFTFGDVTYSAFPVSYERISIQTKPGEDNNKLFLEEVSKGQRFVEVEFREKKLAVVLQTSEVHVFGVIKTDFPEKCIANHNYYALFGKGADLENFSMNALLNEMEKAVKTHLCKMNLHYGPDSVHFYGYMNV